MTVAEPFRPGTEPGLQAGLQIILPEESDAHITSFARDTLGKIKQAITRPTENRSSPYFWHFS